MAILGTAGDDLLPRPGEQDHEFHGLAGNDTITGGTLLYGGDGDDLVVNGWGASQLYGGSGNDVLDGGPLLNLDLRSGNAAPYWVQGFDWLSGGEGTDTARIAASSADVIVTVTGPDSLHLRLREAYYGQIFDGPVQAFFGATGVSEVEIFVFTDRTLTLAEMLVLRGENQIGTSGDDTLQGDYAPNTLSGLDGDDTLSGGAGDNQLYGGDGNDSLTGGADGDLMYGGGGNDKLTSRADHDRLYGGAGDDSLDGGIYSDVMEGGLGNDTYVVRNGATLITGEIGYAQGGGIDTVIIAALSYTAPPNIEVLRLSANWGTNATGNDAPNSLVGNVFANGLSGRGGNDQINGNAGDDTLTGGEGRDTLVGGAGADTFVFTSISNSRAGAANRDVINGFTRAPGDQDHIDLSAIDANTLTGGVNEAFSFIGTAAFSATGSAGQLRLVGLGGPNAVIVEGDVNGDRVADFQIFVNLQNVMTSGDFVL